jgi:molybdopterin/thiamine biosynthesis adenylyltransferase
MTKEQALQEISKHLELLTDYDVIEATFADTLFGYLSEIISEIDDTYEQEQSNILSLWENIKNNKNEDFDTP